MRSANMRAGWLATSTHPQPVKKLTMATANVAQY